MRGIEFISKSGAVGNPKTYVDSADHEASDWLDRSIGQELVPCDSRFRPCKGLSNPQNPAA